MSIFIVSLSTSLLPKNTLYPKNISVQILIDQNNNTYHKNKWLLAITKFKMLNKYFS